MSSSKSSVIICVITGAGHFNPIHSVAKGLIDRGYDVTMVTDTLFRKKVEDRGASFVLTAGRADLATPLGRKYWPKAEPSVMGMQDYPGCQNDFSLRLFRINSRQCRLL
jgi:hypothetical protein